MPSCSVVDSAGSEGGPINVLIAREASANVTADAVGEMAPIAPAPVEPSSLRIPSPESIFDPNWWIMASDLFYWIMVIGAIE